jgi:hypothetical protein
MASRNRVVYGALRTINGVLIRAPRAFACEITFLARSYLIVMSLDLFVINGGGQLTEWGGPWDFPYDLQVDVTRPTRARPPRFPECRRRAADAAA